MGGEGGGAIMNLYSMLQSTFYLQPLFLSLSLSLPPAPANTILKPAAENKWS